MSSVDDALVEPPSLMPPTSPPLHVEPNQTNGSGASAAADLDLSVVQDPILELCPSLDILRRIARSSSVEPPLKRAKLIRALLRAASNGDTDMLSWLLDSRAEARQIIAQPNLGPNGRSRIAFDQIRDEEGTGPVVLATCAGHIDAVTMLVINGAEIDERDACGWTPLMWAINSSNLPLASFLLSRGADVDAKSTKGTTCEDFILSAAPEAAFSTPAGAEQAVTASSSKSAPTEQQAIADLIYEHQRYISVQQSAAQRLNSLFLDNSPDRQQPPSLVDSDRQSSSASPTRSSRPSTSASPTKSFRPGHSRTGSQLTQRRLVGRYERAHLAEQKNRLKELSDTRKSALADIATLLELDLHALIGEPSEAEAFFSPHTDERAGPSATFARRRRRGTAKTAHSDLASGCGAAEVGADLLSVEFDWKRVRNDQMLVFGSNDIEPLLGMLITNIKPVRAPWTSRAAPANVLFLCARYACFLQDEDLLEELFLGAIDRIEGAIYSHPTDMTYLAFWLSNCCLLYYYLDKDRTLRKSSSVKEYRSLLADLLNEIFVFIIRDAERRIDKVLDAAMLDHEAIPGFDEVRFEGEWKFMKTLAGSVKGIGQGGSLGQGMSSSPSKASLSQLFGSGRREDLPSPSNPGTNTPEAMRLSSSPSIGNGRPTHPFGPATIGHSGFRTAGGGGGGGSGEGSPRKGALGDSFRAIREVSYNASATDLLNAPSPRTITSLLSSTLQVLQFYEINPAIIIQALSQIFFWVGCELFNRVISRKRYLCRSRAIQIRMNVSALEDWARSNALPLGIVHAHLSPLSQLISWLQCQSSLQEFDGLIATMQGLKALTPVQMKRVVKDYRYEVGETRMSEECLQYLDQLILDWKRRQEDQIRQAKEEARAVQQRKKKVKKQSSHHQRSGTAKQEDYTTDAPKTLSLDQELLDEEEDDSDGDGEHLAPADAIDGQADASINSNGTAKLTSAHDDGLLTVAEATARSAQAMIDGLFAPGKGMTDYVPPWTASGPPLGLHDDGASGSVAGSVPPSPAKEDGLLNSREMLPFALPSRRNALIVTPGDAFGFGRGHFTGTGTPSVRSVNGDSSSSNPGSAASSRRSSIASSSSLRHPLSENEGDDTAGLVTGNSMVQDEELASETSSHTDASNVSRASSLFPSGQGFAAGGYWSPVPLLPDGMLDRIDAMLKAAAALLPTQGDRSRNILLADHASDEHLPLNFASPTLDGGDFSVGGGMPKSSRIIIPRREDSILQSPKKEAIARLPGSTGDTSWDADEFGTRMQLSLPQGFNGESEEDVKTPGPYRKDTLKASLFG